MNYVTQDQFNDFASRVFLRFDQMDEKMDRRYSQLRSMIDHVGTKLDETNKRLNENLTRLDETIAKMDARVTSLEDSRASHQH